MERSKNRFEHLRKSVVSGIVFSITVAACSVTYAAYTAIANNKAPGNQLSSSEWNAMANDLADHETRVSTLESAVSGRKILQAANAMKADTWSAATT